MLKEQNKGNAKQEEQVQEQMSSVKAQTPKMPNMNNMKVPSIKMPKF